MPSGWTWFLVGIATVPFFLPILITVLDRYVVHSVSFVGSQSMVEYTLPEPEAH